MASATTFPPLVSPADRELLRAATRTDPEGVAAFVRWRAMVALDDVQSAVRLVMPRLLDLATQHRADDPDIGRMRGISRHIWTSNIVRLRVLLAALDALAGANVPVLLLKGAAIFARDASTTTRRMAGDYDILIDPGHIPAACKALAAAGFRPKDMEWLDIELNGPEAATAGTPLELAGALGDVDLHWRPLPNIHDHALTTRLFESAEHATLLGHDVLVPCVAHHLFLAIARCEPWDSNECVARLIEGHFLVSNMAARLDWTELTALVRRYHLQMTAGAYLQALRADCGTTLPADADALGRLDRSTRADAAHEWTARAVAPERRNAMQLRALARFDAAWHRSPGSVDAPGLIETILRQVGGLVAPMRTIRALAARRLRGPSTGARRFLEGFSYPERAGRWTDGHWALLAVPLSDAQRRGEPVRISAHALLGSRARVTIQIHAGRDIVTWRPRNGARTELALTCRGLDRLGGDALVLFWIPDAASPSQLGLSGDRRNLGVFIYRE